MSSMSPALARRIDRLSRRAHAFHRYAHHPLCGAYSTELIGVGRVRVCRGCVYTALGVAAGLGAGLLPAPNAWAVLLLAGAGGVLAAISLVARVPKSASRFLPGVFGGAATIVALRAGGAEAIVLWSICGAGAVGIVAHYRTRGPDRTPCRTCPERDLPSACSGLRPIVQRERAFQRLTGRWLRSETMRSKEGAACRT